MRNQLRLSCFATLASILLLSIFSAPARAADAPTPTFSTATSREDGFSFKITNFSTLYTYTAITDKGYVDVAYHSASFPSGTDLYVIAYGLNKGETSSVTVSAARAGYNTTSATISGGAVAAPSVTSCSPTSVVSGSYTTLQFKSTSESVDRFCDWSVPAGLTSISEIAVVGGGGGGGYWGNAGQGGAGAVLYKSNYSVTPGTSIRVVVGAGGGATFQGTGIGPGHNGNNTIFNGVVAAGGGGGGGGDVTRSPRFCNGFKGGSGGSGNNNSCGSVGGTAIASDVCGCSATWTVYGNAGASNFPGGSAGSSGAGVTLIGVTLGASGTQTASTGNGGAVSTAGSSGLVLLKFLTPPPIATISIAALSESVYKGRAIQVVATLSHPGKVRFMANGKRIAGCLAVTTVGSSPITATCNWKPTVSSTQNVSAILTPTNNAISPVASSIVTVGIKRTTQR